MGVADDLKEDLPVAMIMAAFLGIAWYLCIELTIRLWLSFLRKKGLYFWSCCVASLGVMTQPLFVVLHDFGQIKNPFVGLTLIYVSWWMMVIPQSVVLYSRLHLVLSNQNHNSYVLYMIVATTVFISLPTMGLGIAAQGSRRPDLLHTNQIWDRIQVSVFFLQETIISALYINETRRVLRNRATLGETNKTITAVMHHLIYTNILVVCLDIALLGLSYSKYFYVQSAFKTCVYGVKLRVEFSILNRLVQSLRGSSSTTRTPTQTTNNIETWNKKEYPRARLRAGLRREVRLETYNRMSEDGIVPPGHSQLSSAPTQSLKDAPYMLGKDGVVRTTEISVEQSGPDGVAQPGDRGQRRG